MKLATLKDGSRDGELIVVQRDGRRFVRVSKLAKSLQVALDYWDSISPALQQVAYELESGKTVGHELDLKQLMAPLPRAYEWVDGSAYLNHVLLVRKARNAEPPKNLDSDPLVYQGGSGTLMGPYADIPLPNPHWGLDLEAEVCAILADTPERTPKNNATGQIRLLLTCNDITFRNLVPPEIEKGFGFFCSKPATAFSPFAVTPDELGNAWRDGRIHRPLCSWVNGELLGDPNAGPEMHFSFSDLIAHITKTRAFTAGTILGSGTVSNKDPQRGVSCLAERRAREQIELGAPKTPFLLAGDVVEIDMLDDQGRSIFGRIKQRVVNP